MWSLFSKEKSSEKEKLAIKEKPVKKTSYREKEFTHSDIIRLCVLRSRDIIYMNDKNIISPDIVSASGYESRRVYSYENLICFFVVKILRGFNMQYNHVRSIMETLEDLTKILNI